MEQLELVAGVAWAGGQLTSTKSTKQQPGNGQATRTFSGTLNAAQQPPGPLAPTANTLSPTSSAPKPLPGQLQPQSHLPPLRRSIGSCGNGGGLVGPLWLASPAIELGNNNRQLSPHYPLRTTHYARPRPRPRPRPPPRPPPALCTPACTGCSRKASADPRPGSPADSPPHTPA